MEPQQISVVDQSAAAVAVGALVMALTQASKRWVSDDDAPIVVGLWTVLVMAVWVISQPTWPPLRTSWFDLLAVAVNVWVSAIGLYAAATHVTDRRKRARALADRARQARLRLRAPIRPRAGAVRNPIEHSKVGHTHVDP